MEFLDFKGLTAYEYNRKSSESDERQVASLEDQHKDNDRVISRFQIKRDKSKIFYESKSAKTRGRPVFRTIINDIERGKCNVLVCWHTNRLSRNARESGEIIGLVDEGKLLAIVTPHKIYSNTPDDLAMLGMDLTYSKKYSDDLSQNVKRGLNGKAGRRWWPGKAKPGYLNVKVKGYLIQQADPDRFDKLRKVFDLILEGVAPNVALDTLNDDWGFKTLPDKSRGDKPMSQSQFYRFLHDTFNFGEYRWNNKDYVLDESCPRLITHEEYWKVQKILGSKGIQRPYKHDDIPYRNIITCSLCGSKIITYPKNKKLVSGVTTRYLYAKCSNKHRCKQKHISVVALESQIMEAIKTINISSDFYAWFMKWLQFDHERESTELEISLTRIDNEIEQEQKKLNRAVDMRINDLIDDNTFNNKKNEIAQNVERLELNRSEIKTQNKEWVKYVEERLDFAKSATDKLINGTSEEKTELLTLLGSNFVLNNGILHYDIDSVLKVFQSNQTTVCKELKGFELEEKLSLEENQAIISSWLSNWDLVGTFLSVKTHCI